MIKICNWFELQSTIHFCFSIDVSGKYFDDFEEKESSEESRDEDLQKGLYELSARYCCLDGYEALTAPAPPPPEEKPVKSPKVKTPKKKSKEEKEEKEAKETTESDQNQGKGRRDGNNWMLGKKTDIFVLRHV